MILFWESSYTRQCAARLYKTLTVVCLFVSNTAMATIPYKCTELLEAAGVHEVLTLQVGSAAQLAKSHSELQSQRYVRRQESKFKDLYETTGFHTQDELTAAIRAQGPEAAAVLQMIQNEEVEPVIRVPESARSHIASRGFLTQRETGQTLGGARNIVARDMTEASFSFTKYETYKTMPDQLKPKYGYLRPKAGQILQEVGSTGDRYGDDIFIFKMDNIRQRLTFTIGDSLVYTPNKRNPGEDLTPTYWTKSYVPWSERSLMVPFLLPDYTGSFFEVKLRKLSGSLSSFKTNNIKNNWYFELQIWGPLTLDDVEAYEYTHNPPTGEFLDELIRRGIEIRDGRHKYVGGIVYPN